MADSGNPDYSKFDDVSKKLEDSIKHSTALESVLLSEYWSLVKSEKLSYKDHEFSDELKDKLADSVAKALKEHLISMNPKYAGISDEIFQDSVMPFYFGVDKEEIKRKFKDKKRITQQDFMELGNDIISNMNERLHKRVITQITDDDLEPGRKYLKSISEQYKLPFKEDRIKNEKQLQQGLFKIANYKYQRGLEEKYQ
ncbi:MAG: hypothetical protein NTV63_00900 [Candidatus Woesearchaeota archaeon]|nr:hypothetical protein [Candidatus Woesearchaeota archaeon]